MYYLITAITLTGRAIPLTIRRDTLDAAYLTVQKIIPGALMTLDRMW